MENLLHEFVAKTKGVEAESAAMTALLSEIVPQRAKLIEQAAQDWMNSDDLAFNLIGNGACYQQYLTNTDNARLLLAFDLLRSTKPTVASSKRLQRLASRLATHGGSQCELVILAEIASIFESSDELQANLAIALPLSLRALAGVLQRYLSGKQDKVNSTQDRLEADLLLHEHCEKWVSSSLVRLVRAVSKSSIQHYPSRKYFLNWCCDCVEALLRNILDHTLNEDILNQTLSDTIVVVKEHYALTEIIEEQTRWLKVNNSHDEALKQLEIPACYSPEAQFNRAGAAYIINKYLQDSATTKFYSQLTLTKALVVGTAEALGSPYPFKNELLKRLAAHLTPEYPIRSNFELNYPLSILCERLFTSETGQALPIDSILQAILTPNVAIGIITKHQAKSIKSLAEWLKVNPSKLVAFTNLLRKIDQERLDPQSKALVQSLLTK